MRVNEPVFAISVAARLLEMHPQTLRKYEREGLIEPSRSQGNLRLYSNDDLVQLRQVKYLVEQRRLNLAGVQMAMAMTSQLQHLRKRLTSGGVGTGDVRDLEEEIDLLLATLGYREQ